MSSSRRSTMRLFLMVAQIMVVIVFLNHSALWGQTSQNIVGTIRDQTGAIVPGVTILARHLLTNDSRETSSDEAGDYRIIRLARVGYYEVRAEMAGFKTTVARILLETGQTVRLDLALEVGQITQTVTVQASAPLVRSETSALETVVRNQEILDLPLNKRNFMELTALQPGATTKAPAQERELTVGGARGRDNDFRFDGIRNMEAYQNNMTTRPPLDAIEEFQMIRNLYSAEYGRAMGGIIELRTKSGTNDFHGSIYELARRGAFAAIPYFARTRPNFRTDQYGGSLGGPFRIPKLYNGRDRTFFFFAYERLYSPSQIVRQFYTPTEADRMGDFSQSIYAAPIDPLTGKPFPNGIIPQTRFSLPATNVLKVLPLPNQPLSGDVNWTGNFPNDTDTNTVVIRGDRRFSARHSLFLSGIWSKQEQINADRLDCGTCAKRLSDENFATETLTGILGYTWIIRSNMVLQSRAGFTTFRYSEDINDKTNYPKLWGFDFYPPDTAQNLLGTPRINVGRFAWLGHTNAPFVREENLYNLVNVLSFSRASHYIKVGADVAQDRARMFNGAGARGFYSENGLFTKNQIADFLLGYYSSGRFQFTPDWFEGKRWQHGVFIQDDWKVHPKLTLNLGIRYDYTGPFEAWKTHRTMRFDFRKDEIIYPAELKTLIPDDVKATMLFPYRFEGPSTTYDPDKNNWAPRIGLAYRPFGKSDMVIRTGYGIFYNSPQGVETWQAGIVAPWNAYLTFNPTPQNPYTLQQGDASLRAKVLTTPGTVYPIAPGYTNSYIQQWNLGIQRRLMEQLMLEVCYAGSRSVRLGQVINGDIFAPLYGFNRYFTLVRVTTNGFDARYDSLQVLLQQRFRHGLSFRLNYTLAKLLNDYAEISNSSPPADFNKRREWGRANIDARHSFNLSGIYELPFGRGRTYLPSLHPIFNALLGGWNLSYIVQAISGYPLNLTYYDIYRPDLVPGRDANLPASDRTRDRWFDPTAFQRPATATTCQTVIPNRQGYFQKIPCTGTLGRNALDGPGYSNVDLGIAKLFPIKENHKLEFRMEMFNAFNHPQLYIAGLSLQFDLAGATRLNSARSMRELQFALRYAF